MNGEFGHTAYHDLIVKVLTREATAAEQHALEQWVQENEANQKVFDEYQKVWDNLGKAEVAATVDVDTAWRKLEKVIDALPEQKKTVPLQPKANRWYMRAAAAVLLVLTAAILWRTLPIFNQQQLATRSISQSVQLADGSSVTLNVFSELKFPKTFKEKDIRAVALEGEAFFEVKPNPQKPFVIEAQGVMIEVLGTSFNVKAYEEGGSVEIVVKSGKVAVYREGNKDEKVILLAGDKAVYAKNSDKLGKGVNSNPNYLSWKTKRFVFEDTEMQDVARLLTAVYGQKVVIKGERLKACPLTVTFQGDTLDSILKVLESTLDLKVRKVGDVVELSGKGC